MNWLAQLSLALGLVCSVAADECRGKSDACSLNPVQMWRENDLNFHAETCNLKWKSRCISETGRGKKAKVMQKPPPYFLCTAWQQPSGVLPVDGYTLAMQDNKIKPFAPGAADYTLHGLWPGSLAGDGGSNQPYGCFNGEEFDETILTTFKDLLSHFWPSDPQYKNTVQCFILSEWMKHGTCAVIPGADGSAFRLSQEAYFRTSFVFANEYNANRELRERLPDKKLEPIVSVGCVQCAYLATAGWTATNVSSVPRMSSDCIDKCFSCGNHWDTCRAAQLQSTVELVPSNAPLQPTESNGDEIFPELKFSIPGLMSTEMVSPWEGTWRSFGAEQLGSGKFEFAQTFTDKVLTVTTDSPYPQTCDYERRGPGQLLLRCGGDKPHVEACLVQRLPDIGDLEVANMACNHAGQPAPGSFYAAMDTPGSGNFLMFRCKASAAGCSFSPGVLSAADSKTEETKREPESDDVPVRHSQAGIAGAPPKLLGSWRTLQTSSHYEKGLARWTFTADGQASMEWPNYPSRGVERYSVSRSKKDQTLVLLASASGTVTTCRFKFQHQSVYSYGVLNCGAPGQKVADGEKLQHTQWAMGRCNPCDAHCRYSCGPETDFCGAGSCDPSESKSVPAAAPVRALRSVPQGTQETGKNAHNWCTPDDDSCWPTKTAISNLEQALDPSVPRLGVQWTDYPQPQPAPVPVGSINNQSFYGLGSGPNGLKALYHYEHVDDMKIPCFDPKGNATTWNQASDVCKAALHQNEYRDWNPFIVVFPLNERHVRAALLFAARHRLCIATAGTGHEYLSRNSCPTGGILIRTILLKDKTFLPTWAEDTALAPAGAFRFGAGSIFAEMHNFSAKYDRVVASGWCSTVGMVGFHLGGGHGPFAPSMGLGVDNLLEIEVLQVGRDAYGRPVIHKKIASRHHNPQLFWAMRGGGGGVWGVILSMTIRAHAVPDGGLSRVYMNQTGTFCPGSQEYGYEWLRGMWSRFSAWQLSLNHKVSTQPGFFINTTDYKNTKDLCSVTWSFTFEYFYAGSQQEKEYAQFRDELQKVLDIKEANKHRDVVETNYDSVYKYLLSMKADKFTLSVTNPLPPPHPPSDAATGSQNSVFVSREAMETKFASTMMDVLDICVDSLKTPDDSSPDPSHYRCGFHYLYTSLTGNLGSTQPAGTAISQGFRSGLMLWNARTLTTKQAEDTIYKVGPNSYFSESSYVMHDWTDRYWGKKTYEQLLAVKKAHDPGNHFWCHHCIGDDPADAYGEPLGAAVVGSVQNDVHEEPRVPAVDYDKKDEL